MRDFRAASGGGGVGDFDAAARGTGAVRPVAEKQEDIAGRASVFAGSEREDREDAGRADAPGFKTEPGVDLATGTILAVTVQDAAEGDGATLPETLAAAAAQVEAVRPEGGCGEEVIADKGCPSDKTLAALGVVSLHRHSGQQWQRVAR